MLRQVPSLGGPSSNEDHLISGSGKRWCGLHLHRPGETAPIPMGSYIFAEIGLHFMGRTSEAEKALSAWLAAERKQQDDLYWSRVMACPAQAQRHPKYRRACRECWNKICARMQAIGLDDDGNPLPSAHRPFCDARTKAGGTCRHKIIPGKARCRFHGGKSTGPKTEEGKARIAEAQRRRWARWRQSRQTSEDET